MDIDIPGGDGLLIDDSHDHAHLIWIPAFSKSFPLPFRVLTLIGFGIFCWAVNLHGLRLLGVEEKSIMRIGGGRTGDQNRSQRGDPYSVTNEHTNYRAFYHSVYRIFLVYAAWVLAWWCLFRWMTHGEEDAINRCGVLPAIAFAGIILFLISPFPYQRHARESFLQATYRCLLPQSSHPTRFSDIILADIFTSFAKVFGDLWISAYMIFSVGHITSIPVQEGMLQLIVPTMMSLPYFVRLRQCCIDYYASDRRSKRQLWNALKYATAFPVIFLSSAQSIVLSDLIAEKGEAKVFGTLWHGEHTLFRLWLLFVFINSVYSFWWDVTNDWGLTFLDPALWTGLGRPEQSAYIPEGGGYSSLASQTNLLPDGSTISHSRSYNNRTPDLTLGSTPLPSPVTVSGVTSRVSDLYIHSNGSTSKMSRAFGLRSRLVYQRPIFYYCAIALNLLLRLTWSLKLSTHLHNVAEFGSGVFMMEALEIVRRWMWVFFRVEWEVVRKGENWTAGEAEESDHEEDYELRGHTLDGDGLPEDKEIHP